MKSQAMVLVPRATLDRAPRTRAGRKGRLTEWAFTGVPVCSSVWYDDEGALAGFQMYLPMDVISKPRTTQRSVWSPRYQNYQNWRRIFQGGVSRALANAGVPLPAGDESLFGAALAADPWVKRLRNSFAGPISVRLLICTKRQGDADNRTKSVLDAGNGFLWPDDRMVASEGCTLVRDAWSDPFCALRCARLPQEGRLARALEESGIVMAELAPHLPPAKTVKGRS